MSIRYVACVSSRALGVLPESGIYRFIRDASCRPGGRAVLDETCHLSVEHHENSTLSLHCCTTVGVSVQLQGAGAARLTGVRPGEIRLNVRPVGPESVC